MRGEGGRASSSCHRYLRWAFISQTAVPLVCVLWLHNADASLNECLLTIISRRALRARPCLPRHWDITRRMPGPGSLAQRSRSSILPRLTHPTYLHVLRAVVTLRDPLTPLTCLTVLTLTTPQRPRTLPMLRALLTHLPSLLVSDVPCIPSLSCHATPFFPAPL